MSSIHEHITDKELLEKFQADRSNYWLGILLDRYTMLLLGVCMKYLKNEEEAKDAVQQIFLKVITELQKYKVEYFKSWLYMIAKNYCLMRLRDKKITISVEDKLHLESEETDTKALLHKDEILNAMQESVNELNEGQRICVTKFYFEKKSYNEIVAETPYTLLQVKSYIQNGKRNLKILIDNKINNNAGK